MINEKRCIGLDATFIMDDHVAILIAASMGVLFGERYYIDVPASFLGMAQPPSENSEQVLTERFAQLGLKVQFAHDPYTLLLRFQEWLRMQEVPIVASSRKLYVSGICADVSVIQIPTCEVPLLELRRHELEAIAFSSAFESALGPFGYAVKESQLSALRYLDDPGIPQL